MGGAVPLLPLYAFAAWTGKFLPLPVTALLSNCDFQHIKSFIKLEYLVVHWQSVAHYYRAFYRNCLRAYVDTFCINIDSVTVPSWRI